MSLTPLEIGADIAAVALAATKLLSSAQALWDKLPRAVAVALPVLVAMLPQVAAAAGLVKTEGDLLTLALTSAALLVPGIAEAEKSA